jgi:hypothetical protein
MNQILSNRFLLLAARFVLGIVFVVAAVPKIAQPDAFAVSVEAYEILPVAVVNLIAVVVPWLELLCAVFLIGGARVRPSAALLGVMLAVFIVAISTAVLRGLNINCGCYGGTGTPVGWGKVLEDVALLVPVWLLLRRGPGGGDEGAGEGRAGAA